MVQLPDVDIKPLAAFAAQDQARLLRDLADVFFSSSNTQVFSLPSERTAFLERWFGRYAARAAKHFLVATGRGNESGPPRALGYLAGWVKNAVGDPEFADIAYFAVFEDLIARRFPAHLHVNVAEESRGRGVGGALVAAFAAHCQALGVAGFHVVTRKGARNIAFYKRCGLSVQAHARVDDRDLVLLGRDLTQ